MPILASLLFVLLALPAPAHSARQDPNKPAEAKPVGKEPKKRAEAKTSEQGPRTPAEAKLAIEAARAKLEAESARSAARRANAVAAHSVHIREHAKVALKHVHKAIQAARAATNQTASKRSERELVKAEEKIRAAGEAGEFTNATAEREKAERRKREEKMEEEAAKKLKEWKDDLKEMQEEVDELIKKLAGTKQEEELREIKDLLRELEKEKPAGKHDELKAELKRLRDAVERIKASKMKGKVEVKMSRKEKAPEPKVSSEKREQRGGAGAKVSEMKRREPDSQKEAAGRQGSLDVDTDMPYGAIEPFGREDTAQELTEASIRESNKMVDSLERAEVAEEKRATFRALTRLRGAAIASYDGIARSQTGNVDEYSSTHRWRPAHPLRHLAEEESDISKWAFPDADF